MLPAPHSVPYWAYTDTGLTATSWSNNSYFSALSMDTIKWQVYGYSGAGNGPWSDIYSFLVVGGTPVHPSAPPVALAEAFSFRNSTAVYDLPAPCPVSLSLFTLSGRRISVLDRLQQAGRYTVSLKRHGLAPGAYFLHFKAGRIERKMRVVVE